MASIRVTVNDFEIRHSAKRCSVDERTSAKCEKPRSVVEFPLSVPQINAEAPFETYTCIFFIFI